MFNLALMRPPEAEDVDERDPKPANDNAAAALGLHIVGPEHSHPGQWFYITCLAKLVAVLCSRRWGKTEGAIRRAVWLVLQHENRRGHYVNLTRRNARKQFFRPLVRFLEKPLDQGGLGWVRGLHFQVNEVDMIVTTAWGSTVQAFSCPTMREVASVRGDRSDWFCIDECQSPNDDLVVALVETSSPMRRDTGGTLEMLGTPPEVEPCYFSDALDSDGWAHFSGHQFEHDFPRPREEKWADAKADYDARKLPFAVKESANDNGRLVLEVDPDNTHPSILREDFGRRHRDQSKFAYKYQRGRNDYDPAAVDFGKGGWRIGWGIDIGGPEADSDQDSLVIQAQRRDDPARAVYVRWHWAASGSDVFGLADLVRVVKNVLRPNVAIGDTGGHGAPKAIASLGTVLGLTIGKKPPEVMTSVRLVNDAFEGPRLFFPTDQSAVTGAIRREAHRIYAAEPERLQRVLDLIDAGTGDDLGAEVAAVSKVINPRTKKYEINTKGKHSNKSEANRYAYEGLLRGPAAPAAGPDPGRPAAPDELADWEREQARKKADEAERQKRARGRY